MNIIVEKGNLFELSNKTYMFAHCISLDCEMGAGIAKEFDKKYSGMKSYCKRVVSENHLDYPCIIPYYKSESKKVLNLVTKNKYWNKPTYESITKTIEEMAYLCRTSNIKYLAIPKIGCGLDKLSWPKVKEIIEENFNDLDIEIRVRHIDRR